MRNNINIENRNYCDYRNINININDCEDIMPPGLDKS
jgi:hypothetical protein